MVDSKNFKSDLDDNPFTELNRNKKEKYRRVIKDAIRITGVTSFTESCEKFLNETGFLTDKQIEALELSDIRRRYDLEDWRSDYEQHSYLDVINEW